MDALLDYSVTRIVEPVLSAVTLAEAKKQANVIADDDDELLERLLAAATEQVERDSARALLTQRWRMTRHGWPRERRIVLPRPPLQSVVSVTYRDTGGVTQTLPQTSYIVDGDREPGVLWLEDDVDWPALVSSRPNSVTITWLAGWPVAADVPQRAKQAILLLVAHWYRSREPVVFGSSKELELTYEALVTSLRPKGYP